MILTLHMHPEHLIQLINRANTLLQQPESHSCGIKFIFPANQYAVRNALDDTIAALRFLDYSHEEYGTIELVLAEVMNNIVEHAYSGDPDGMIELEIAPSSNGLNCTLRDNGKPMPDGNVPIGILPIPNIGAAAPVNNLPEGGFGWFLIQDLARDLQYMRQGQKNILTFRIATRPQNMRSN